MTSLTVASVLALAASCQHVVAPVTVLTIAQAESRLDPSARHQNRDGTWDLGLMQINERNMGWLGLKDPFDPCQSIYAAAKLLESFSRYNTGSPLAGITNGYALKVMHIGDDAAAPASPQPKQEADDPRDPKPPAWDMEAVAAWRWRHDPSAEDAAEASPVKPSSLPVIASKDPK